MVNDTPIGLKLRRFELAALLLIGVPLLVAMAALFYRSTLLYPINYNEGWNAYHASALAAEGILYYPPDSLLTNNYPPISFFLTSYLAGFVGDTVLAGRLIAYFAFVSVIAAIVTVSWQLEHDLIAALFAGEVFAAYMITNYHNYVGMNDPQMLAHAVILLGLFVYFRHANSWWSSIGSAVLMCCGLFIKHNVVALPITFALWLFAYDRGASVRFIGSGVFSAALGMGWSLARFGWIFIEGLAAPREYLPLRGYQNVIRWLFPMELLLILSALGSAIPARNRFSILWGGYVIIAVAVAGVAAGGAGTSFNVMFEVVIACSFAAGHLIARLDAGYSSEVPTLRHWVIGAYVFAAAINAAFVETKSVLLVWPLINDWHAREAATRKVVQLIAERPGPSLCDTIVLCYWAHKPFELDPLNFEQGVRAGIKDENIVLSRINSLYYATIQVADGVLDPGYVSPRLRSAIENRYSLVATPPAAGPILVYIRP